MLTVLNKLKDYISEERLRLYLHYTNNDVEKAINLYNLNIKVSESFHTSLEYFEVIFRNTMNVLLKKYYGNDWYNNNFILPKQKVIINDLIKLLKEEEKEINTNNIVSNVSFGFWLSFFSGYYKNSLSSIYDNIFKIPIARPEIYKKLLRIKDLRNRIAHRENIIKYYFMKDYGLILQLISFIDKDISKYIDNLSNVKNIFNQNEKELMNFADFNYELNKDKLKNKLKKNK